MSVNLRVLVPEGTTNYITNPSIRYVTTGWNAVGSSISRSLTKARFGIASLRVVTNGSAWYEGAFFRVSSLTGVSDPITVSAYVLGTGRVRIRLIDNPTGKEYYSAGVTLRADRWTRLEVSGRCTGSDDLRLYIETDSLKATTFYVDGAQMERKAYATTYCDGDQPGCRWNLESNNSVSSRDPYTREGGRWVALAGPCRYNDDLYVTVLGGLGMPPIENRTQSWAQAPGSYFQDIKILSRVITFNFYAKHKDLRILRGASLSHIHELRQQLIDLIKPDKTYGGEAFLFEYSAGDRPLYIRLRYEAGLEGEWDVRNGVLNAFPVRFVAVDPLFSEDSQGDYTLNFSNTFPDPATTNNMFGRINKVWTDLSGSLFSSEVSCLAIGPRGELYAGVGTIYKLNGTSWTSIGASNATVYGMAVAPNGDIYATGSFTSIGGVAANRIAKYTAATGAWSALGTGLNDVGRCIVVAHNGTVYVGGQFTTAGGISALRIARWDGTQFRTVGATSGVNSTVYALALSKDGTTLYMGGNFTTYPYIAQIDTNTNLISSIASGYGFNNIVYALAVGDDGTLYAGGQFTSSATFNGARIAKLQGSRFVELGEGFEDGIVYSLAVAPDGTLYIGGTFTLSGTTLVHKVAKWVPDVIYPVDFIPSKITTAVPPYVQAIAAHPNGDIYLGLGSVYTSSFSSALTTVDNVGTTEVKPVIYIGGPGILRYLENQTTGKKIHMQLTLLDDEDVLIDFSKGTIKSTSRGDLFYSIINPSDFGDFTLIPGENIIAAFMTNDVDSAMKLSYIPRHWSGDAVSDAEDLQ